MLALLCFVVRYQGRCAIYDIRPKLILNSNLAKSRSSITSVTFVKFCTEHGIITALHNIPNRLGNYKINDGQTRLRFGQISHIAKGPAIGGIIRFQWQWRNLRMINHIPPRTMIDIIIIKQAQQAIRMFYGIYCMVYVFTVHGNIQVHWCSLNHRLQLVLLAVLKWNTKEWKKYKTQAIPLRNKCRLKFAFAYMYLFE